MKESDENSILKLFLFPQKCHEKTDETFNQEVDDWHTAFKHFALELAFKTRTCNYNEEKSLMSVLMAISSNDS